MTDPIFIPYRPARITVEEVGDRARLFYELMNGRRSVRMFSPDPVPREAVEQAIATASTAGVRAYSS